MLHHQDFIKADYPFHREYTGKNIAPLFRKKFLLSAPGKARLLVCGLGYGYYYVNGKKSEITLILPQKVDFFSY